MIVPNNTLANEVLKNLTMGDVTRVCRMEVLVPLRASATSVREALLEHARKFDGLDARASGPSVYWVRIDERGVLLRLVAPCIDGAAADRLAQSAFGEAARLALPV
jgi:hypothetical protein